MVSENPGKVGEENGKRKRTERAADLQILVFILKHQGQVVEGKGKMRRRRLNIDLMI